MGLYPAIALFFCLVKLFPSSFETTCNVFFLFWLVYTVYSYIIKSPFKVNKHALLLAGVLGIAIPLINGLTTGLWLWKSYGLGYSDTFFVDILWLIMGTITMISALIIKPVEKKNKSKEERKVSYSYQTQNELVDLPELK